MKFTTGRSVLGRSWSSLVAGVAVVCSVLTVCPSARAQGDRSAQHWVGTWATAVVERAARSETPSQSVPAPPGQAAQTPRPLLNFNNQTLRQIVHTSLGGERIRVVLSNAFGTAPLTVGGAHLALRDKGAAIVATSDRPLTFSGNPTTTIPAGAVMVSDPVTLTVPSLADLVIDLYLPGDTAASTSPLTIHAGAQQTNYVSPSGNHVGAAEMPVTTTTESWFFLARVEVTAPDQVGAIVTLGDSITDGTRSSVDSNNRWPDHLAKRLVAQHAKMGVLNLGISGNRLLLDGVGPGALARFERDVLGQSGVTHVVVLEGINDIRHTSPPVTAAELIAAHRQIIERAHTRGLKIYGAILTPFEPNLWSPENEATRKALNDWIRSSKAYDGVIDFDAVVRDPNHATQLLPRYDSGDHIHPNDAGYQSMGNALNLELFKGAQRTTMTAAR